MRKTRITPYRNLDVDETGAVVSAQPAEIIEMYLFNNAAAVQFLKIYNKATAATSADTPVKTLPLPVKVPVVINLTDAEYKFGTGISIRSVTGIADNDNTGSGTNEVSVNFGLVEYAERV